LLRDWMQHALLLADAILVPERLLHREHDAVVSQHDDRCHLARLDAEHLLVLPAPDRCTPDAITTLDLGHVEHRAILPGHSVDPAQIPILGPRSLGFIEGTE